MCRILNSKRGDQDGSDATVQGTSLPEPILPPVRLCLALRRKEYRLQKMESWRESSTQFPVRTGQLGFQLSDRRPTAGARLWGSAKDPGTSMRGTSTIVRHCRFIDTFSSICRRVRARVRGPNSLKMDIRALEGLKSSLTQLITMPITDISSL
ncbi:hypothetical protein BO85DRAFT_131513 [Aspergillus piperis CBS 112811]|uniref:Uncharacterized protein n=1 Tax=Aspergillus piperis CBS 112811 TaxID=1448313 RepID=A0A8G1R915_9EURO|nr:hypothetical protein BO85DRAFT_131513 [Aspergillus piperis CBS 112811]RAH62321.1 hypothetical protein BO85DRAFT_131513 [Aspergillus piperis CBS 112811]